MLGSFRGHLRAFLLAASEQFGLAIDSVGKAERFRQYCTFSVLVRISYPGRGKTIILATFEGSRLENQQEHN